MGILVIMYKLRIFPLDNMQKFQNVEKIGLNLWADCCIFDSGNDSKIVSVHMAFPAHAE